MSLTIPRFSSNAALRSASENKAPLRQGATGEGVAILQQALIDLGFDMPNSTHQRTTLPDGIFGSETTLTVKSFQRQNGLSQDGVVGRQTLDSLERLVIAASVVAQIQFAHNFSQTSLVG